MGRRTIGRSREPDPRQAEGIFAVALNPAGATSIKVITDSRSAATSAAYSDRGTAETTWPSSTSSSSKEAARSPRRVRQSPLLQQSMRLPRGRLVGWGAPQPAPAPPAAFTRRACAARCVASSMWPHSKHFPRGARVASSCAWAPASGVARAVGCARGAGTPGPRDVMRCNTTGRLPTRRIGQSGLTDDLRSSRGGAGPSLESWRNSGCGTR